MLRALLTGNHDDDTNDYSLDVARELYDYSRQRCDYDCFSDRGKVIFWIVVIPCVILCGCLGACTKAQSEARVERAANIVIAEANARRDTDEPRTNGRPRTTPPHPARESNRGAPSADDRKEFIASVLKTETFAGAREENSSSSRTIATRSEDGGAEHCAICLEGFDKGEEVCSSHNVNCNHGFHRPCISEWLAENEDCPCCRRDFLSFDSVRDNENGDDDIEANRAGMKAALSPSAPVSDV
jgi:hypothetical protein